MGRAAGAPQVLWLRLAARPLLSRDHLRTRAPLPRASHAYYARALLVHCPEGGIEAITRRLYLYFLNSINVLSPFFCLRSNSLESPSSPFFIHFISAEKIFGYSLGCHLDMMSDYLALKPNFFTTLPKL